MNALPRIVSALFLSVMLVFSSVAFGLVQGQARAAGSAILCIDDIAVEVAVDALGQPTKASHHCPDCFANLVVADLGQTPTVKAPTTQTAILFATQRAQRRGALALVPRGRGPPAAA